MSRKQVRCPYCMSLRTKKKGKQDDIQRYQCNECRKKFRAKRKTNRLNEKLWHEYTNGKQTLIEIGDKTHRSYKWVRRRLDEITVSLPTNLTPQSTIIVPDTTFWGRHYGVMVFRSRTLRRNLWWSEVVSEKEGRCSSWITARSTV